MECREDEYFSAPGLPFVTTGRIKPPQPWGYSFRCPAAGRSTAWNYLPPHHLTFPGGRIEPGSGRRLRRSDAARSLPTECPPWGTFTRDFVRFVRESALGWTFW